MISFAELVIVYLKLGRGMEIEIIFFFEFMITCLLVVLS